MTTNVFLHINGLQLVLIENRNGYYSAEVLESEDGVAESLTRNNGDGCKTSKFPCDARTISELSMINSGYMPLTPGQVQELLNWQKPKVPMEFSL